MAKVCADDRDLYEDLPSCKGQKSLPGTRNHMYLVRKANITAWPEWPDADTATLEEVAKVKGDFTLAADKKWLKVELVPNQNNIASERVGTFGAYLFRNTYTAVVPGSEEKQTALAAELVNDDCIFLVPQRNGKYRLIGNQMFNVDISPALATGSTVEDTNAITFTIACEDTIPAPFYPGKIATSDGDVSGATGEVTPEEEEEETPGVGG